MLKSTHKLAIATGAALLLVGASSHAGITEFSEDFESLTVADGVNGLDDLANAGWDVAGNVYDGDTSVEPYPGNYLYFYGWFTAPNTGGGAFSAIANDDVSANNSGTNYLNVYNNYDAREAQESGQITNAIIAQEYTIDASEIGKTVTLAFDAKRPDFEDDFLGGDASSAAGNKNCSVQCVANAFVKTLDPLNNYNTTNYELVETTAISQSDWTSYTITVDLTDPLLEGQLLQVGFESFATGDGDTGVYYDNIVLTVGGVVEPTSANVPIPTIALLGFGALLAWSGMSSIRKRLS